MKEVDVTIPLSQDGLSIYGSLSGNYTEPLVLLCHGYGGNKDEMLMRDGARALNKAGFATLRLSMYDGGPAARPVTKSDVITHAHDIDDVVAHAKKAGSDWVAVVGHSFSGMAIVYSLAQQFDAAVLWDPTHTDAYKTPEAIANLKNDFVFDVKRDAYVSSHGTTDTYARTVFENDYATSQQAAQKFQIPTCTINADWSQEQQAYGKGYADTISAPAKQVIIPNSSHPFTEDGAAEKLFAATAEYLKSLL